MMSLYHTFMLTKILIILLSFSNSIKIKRKLNTITINGISVSSNDSTYINFIIFNNITSLVSSTIETESEKNKIFYYSNSTNNNFFLNNKESIIKKIFQIDSDDDIIIWSNEIINNEKALNSIFFHLFNKDGKYLSSTNEFTDIITVNLEINSNFISSDLFKWAKYLYEKNSIDVFNINSRYYTDYCYRENIYKKDFIREDKIDEIFLNVCENSIISIFMNNEPQNQKCLYKSINYSSNIIQCECKINNKLNYPNFYRRNNFFDAINQVINLRVIKCNNMFQASYIKKNFGFYFVLFLIILNIIIFILFIIYDYPKIKKAIEDVEKYNRFGKNINDFLNLPFEKYWNQKGLTSDDEIKINKLKDEMKENLDDDIKELGNNIIDGLNNKKTEIISQNFEENDDENVLMNVNTVKETISDIFKHFINKKIYSIEEIKKNMMERLIKLLISNLIFYLCLLLFCNSLLFGENIIHINHIHNNLKFYQIFLIGNFAIFITILLFIPLKSLSTISDIIFLIIKGIMEKKQLNEILIKYIKNTITRVFIYYIIEFILMGFIFYYVTVFCGLYYHSVKSMFYCYIIGLITTIIYLIIFVIIYYLINKNINFKKENPFFSIFQILKIWG